MKSRSTRRSRRVLCFASLYLLCNPSWGVEFTNKWEEFEDLTKQSISWDIPAGNIWVTMAQFQRQGRAISGVACNFCSGPQPCSDADIQKGSCVPQCPGPTDKDRIVNVT